MIAALVVFSLLGGCASTELGDKINKSVEGALSSFNQPKSPRAAPATHTEASTSAAAPAKSDLPMAKHSELPDDVLPIGQTALAGIFAKHPYDGTPKTAYPRVAVTVQDWSRPTCWIAHATMWHSSATSENIPAFSVCWTNSLANSVDRAANYQLFLRQYAHDHSGNVRGIGPKPPMFAYPMDAFGASQWQKSQDAIAFVQQLIMESGWKAGSPTNLWVVGYAK